MLTAAPQAIAEHQGHGDAQAQQAQVQLAQHNHAPAQAPAGTDYSIGALKIFAPWTRATPKGAQVGGGYLKIANTGKEADRLVGGSLPQAGRFEVHEMSNKNGIDAHARIAERPRDQARRKRRTQARRLSSTFMQLKEPLVQGKPLKGTLVFEKAGTIEIEYQVAPIGAKEMPASGGHGHH